MKLMRLIETWAPAAVTILLLNLPTGRYQVYWVDGPPQAMWGWPLPWMANSYIESGANDIYLGPLVINLAVLAVIAWLIVRVLGRVPRVARNTLLIATWLFALPLLLWAGFLAGFSAILAPEVIDYSLWYWDWPVDRIEGPLSGMFGG